MMAYALARAHASVLERWISTEDTQSMMPAQHQATDPAYLGHRLDRYLQATALAGEGGAQRVRETQGKVRPRTSKSSRRGAACRRGLMHPARMALMRTHLLLCTASLTCVPTADGQHSPSQTVSPCRRRQAHTRCSEGLQRPAPCQSCPRPEQQRSW